MHKLILASQSPRRHKLLSQHGYAFDTFTVKLSESLRKDLNLPDAMCELARQKAWVAVEQHKHLNSRGFLILAADTLVSQGNSVLGKPESREQARQYLCQLSGQWHSVLTAVCLYEPVVNKMICEVAKTAVKFRELTEEVLEEYLDLGTWKDKAGAYGYQDDYGKKFVEHLSGDEDTVIGLPMKLVEELLQRGGWSVARLKV